MIRIAPWHMWKLMAKPGPRTWFSAKRMGIFRNLPGVVEGRCGFFILEFEFGSRNPRDKIGVWLKHHGMWPW